MEKEEIKIQIQNLFVKVVDTAVQIQKTLVNTKVCANCPVKRCFSYSTAAKMQEYLYPPQADGEVQL